MIDATDEWNQYIYSARLSHFGDILARIYMPFAESVACKIVDKLPFDYDLECAFSDAYMALATSIPKFENGHGACFETFVGQRIFGEIMDSIRKQDMLTRSVRDGGRTMNRIEKPVAVNEAQAFFDSFNAEIWSHLRMKMNPDDNTLLWHIIQNKHGEATLRRMFHVDAPTLVRWIDRIKDEVRLILVEQT